MGRRTTIILSIFAALIVIVLVLWDAPRNRVEMFLERDAIEKVARAYLRAEAGGDSRRVYAFLAPSSPYRRTHSYEEYLKDVADDPSGKIDTYKIVNVYRLRDNDNRRSYPGVDKFVQVEVEVTFTRAGPNSVYNYSFTFLKEKGVWYKG